MHRPASPLLDNLARLMTDAVGVADGARREAETFMRGRIEAILRDADVVSREEFEAVRAMAIAARDENERLLARIEALEQRLAG